MVLNVFALLFVLGLTFLHSLFGLFSGLINVTVAIVSLGVAFGFVEPVNNLLTGSANLHSSYTEPLTLVLLFVITFFVLRFLTDTFIRGNVHIPRHLDWIGGGVCGFVIAQICVGVMVLGFLMLPFGGRVMMFERIERDVDEEVDPDTNRVYFDRNHLWLRSDEFAAGLASLLSSGSLRAGARLADVYPDYPEWVFWSGNQVQHESLTAPTRDKGDGFREGVKVKKWWVQITPPGQVLYRKKRPTQDDIKSSQAGVDPSMNLPPWEPTEYRLQPGHKLIGMRLGLTQSAADRDDKDSVNHRFRPTVIRLVGDVVQPDGSREPQQHAAQILGGADPLAGSTLRLADPDTNFSMLAISENELDVYFEVPEEFEPRFVEYRRHARAAVVAGQREEKPPEDQLAALVRDSSGQIVKHGMARLIDDINLDASGDKPSLPFKISVAKLGSSAEAREGALASVEVGSEIITGRKRDLQGEGGQTVDRLLPPEGQRIFKLESKTRKMQSLAGQIMNFVGATTNVYTAIGNDGKTYPLAGYYALYDRDGDQYLELFYTPNPADVGFQGRLDKLSREGRKALREHPDAILGLIFVVPPGTCIKAVETGGGGSVALGQDICVGQ